MVAKLICKQGPNAYQPLLPAQVYWNLNNVYTSCYKHGPSMQYDITSDV